jgi:hypothetical protein
MENREEILNGQEINYVFTEAALILYINRNFRIWLHKSRHQIGKVVIPSNGYHSII